jgi:hypothetical protein
MAQRIVGDIETQEDPEKDFFFLRRNGFESHLCADGDDDFKLSSRNLPEKCFDIMEIRMGV